MVSKAAQKIPGTMQGPGLVWCQVSLKEPSVLLIGFAVVIAWLFLLNLLLIAALTVLPGGFCRASARRCAMCMLVSGNFQSHQQQTKQNDSSACCFCSVTSSLQGFASAPLYLVLVRTSCKLCCLSFQLNALQTSWTLWLLTQRAKALIQVLSKALNPH